MNLSIAQRFDGTQTSYAMYAPLSHGCPAMIFAIDRFVFEKTDEEKAKLYTFKKHLGKSKHHKFVTILKGSF